MRSGPTSPVGFEIPTSFINVLSHHTLDEGNERNDLSTYVNLIADTNGESFIGGDSEVVQRNGAFVFEEGFEE